MAWDSPITRYDRNILDTLRVAAITGVQWSERELEGHPADTVGEYRQLLGMLVEGRVDMVLGSTLSVESILKKSEPQDQRIRLLKPLVFCSALYHYVNVKNERIIPLLEKALAELWAEGRWGDGGPCPSADAD